ncbi:hypothetical protein [Listeria seeligeri]|uniref:hypothetical protein n=1 Tax=Listeria seeligeri TaxID=1640 RepID=UPI0016294D75|nr:hypothetical protein [Listeria seeligeri]MBC1722300.1 hypothetical protein [Listeria seeligeri]MBF2435827.1 hypothetical protein [Listeria seeligeri]
MPKKNKENNKNKNGNKKREKQNLPNQNSIIKELQKLNRNLESTIHSVNEKKSPKKIEKVGKWLSVLIPILISTFLTVYIYLDNKQLSIENSKTTNAMNDFTKSNAPIKYKLQIENIKAANDKTNLIIDKESIRQEKLNKLTANVQISQGSISKGYLVQSEINKPITENCFKYLGSDPKMTSEFMSYGTSLLKTGQFYLVFEGTNGNLSINFVQVQSVEAFDAAFKHEAGGNNSVTIFSSPIPYMEVFDLSYDEFIANEKIQKINNQFETSFLNYQKESLELSKGIITSYEMQKNIDDGFEEISKNEVEKISQKEILSDVQEIKKVYHQFYN